VFVEADPHLMGIALDVAKDAGLELKRGVIATGDQFVADPARKQWVKETFDASAIEMEGAAVAFVCDALGVPFFVLRAISDAADADAGFDFDEFLVGSSKVSADFIAAMLDRIADGR
jgi:adenosylhomocysteine/aminodeoxyfutalosine nucleosidase